MVLQENVATAITDGFNEAPGPFSLVKCPCCGFEYSHVFMKTLSEADTGTRQGGYLLEFEFECGCPNVGYVIAEHKGRCVSGTVNESCRNITYGIGGEGHGTVDERA